MQTDHPLPTRVHSYVEKRVRASGEPGLPSPRVLWTRRDCAGSGTLSLSVFQQGLVGGWRTESVTRVAFVRCRRVARQLLEGLDPPLVPERELEDPYRDALNRLALATGPDEVESIWSSACTSERLCYACTGRAGPSASSRSDCMASILSRVYRTSPRLRQRSLAARLVSRRIQRRP